MLRALGKGQAQSYIIHRVLWLLVLVYGSTYSPGYPPSWSSHDLLLVFLSWSQKHPSYWLDAGVKTVKDAHHIDWIVHYSKAVKKKLLMRVATIFCECFQPNLHPAHPISCSAQDGGGRRLQEQPPVSCHHSSCQIYFCSLQLTINHTLLSC